MVGLPLPNFLLRMPGCKAHKVGVCNLQSRHFRPQLGLPNLINHLGFQNPPSVLESFPEQIPLSAASRMCVLVRGAQQTIFSPALVSSTELGTASEHRLRARSQEHQARLYFPGLEPKHQATIYSSAQWE